MFTHKFTTTRERSPEFEMCNSTFRLYKNADSIFIEYLGKSYIDLEFIIEGQYSEKSFSFIFAFSVIHPRFELSYFLNNDTYSGNYNGNDNSNKDINNKDINNKDINNNTSNNSSGSNNRKDDATIKIKISENKNNKPFVGLKNLGATCYINSLFQTLYHLQNFKEYIYNSRGYYCFLLSRLFYNLDENNNQKINGYSYKIDDSLNGCIRNLNFVDCVNTHQDVHEFSKILFDRLEMENNEIKKLIDGTTMAIFSCECGCKHTKQELIQDLTLLVKDFTGSASNMEESLKIYTREEEIEQYVCEKHGKQRATKKMVLNELPPVLFVLINRFGMDWETGRYVKCNDYYEFQEEFCFDEYMHRPDNRRYRLHGVIVHDGVVDEGHFYCFIKVGGKFYKFNDDSVYEACKEEAINWNFGGNCAAKNQQKSFSAYYLVYLRDDVENSENFVPQNLNELVKRNRENVSLKYVTNTAVQGYTGLGRFNTKDPSYPIVRFSVKNIMEFDNVSKIFKNSKVYKNGIEHVQDCSIDPSAIYFITAHGSAGKLVFIKIYSPLLWCNYPTSLMSIGAHQIQNFEFLASFCTWENFHVISELPDPHEITSFDQINDGDILILTENTKELYTFIERYKKHAFVNVEVGEMYFSIFTDKDIDVPSLDTKIQEFVSSREIHIVSDLTNNKVMCTLTDGLLLYVGIDTGVNDINLISHIHVFHVENNATVEVLIRKFLASKAPCMAPLQTCRDIQVISSHRESTNVRVLDEREILSHRDEYIIIQKEIKDPIKVSFYVGSYQLINYPFLIENPHTIRKMRDKYFFTNKIVKFDGTGYYECMIDDPIDFKPTDALLVEKK